MLKFIVAFLVTALTACGHGPQRVTSTRNCPLPQGLPTGKLLLFGEMHGSVEAPKLISDLACSLSKSEEIAIGLEIPSQDQPLIDNYLKSLGTKEDIETLTSGYFWQKKINQSMAVEKRKPMMEKLICLAETGKLKLPVDVIYPMNDVKNAATASLQSSRKGKVLLRP